MTVPTGRAGRRLLALAALLILLQAASVAQARPAAAEGSPMDSRAEIAACIASYGPAACHHAEDAANWATDVTVWQFDRSSEDDITDAFRHCAWMGALATRVGRSRAIDIGWSHEYFAAGEWQARAMDYGNNYIGSRIGQSARDRRLADQWGEVLWTCRSYASRGTLIGLGGVRGNYDR